MLMSSNENQTCSGMSMALSYSFYRPKRSLKSDYVYSEGVRCQSWLYCVATVGGQSDRDPSTVVANTVSVLLNSYMGNDL